MSTVPSHHAILLVLCGPSGVGKSTISNRLAKDIHFEYLLSATTRTKRPADDSGKKYDHISMDEFFRRLDADEFLEYAVSRRPAHLYSAARRAYTQAAAGRSRPGHSG